MNKSQTFTNQDFKNRYLVTTSDERTWQYEHPVIFLDRKCLLPDRKNRWEKLDYCVFEDNSNFIEDKIKLTNEVKNKTSSIIEDLVEILNKYHKTDFSLNFWQILIGHWLEIYIGTFLERENQIKSILKSNTISGAKFIKFENIELIPKDLNSMIQNLQNATWQSSIDLKIISNLTGISFQFDVIEESTHKQLSKETVQNHLKRPKFRSLVKNGYNKIALLLTRENEAYINSTYLSPLYEALLELSFFQIPKFWRLQFQYIETAIPDLNSRKKLTRIIQNGSDSDLIINELFNLMPVCYLEGFSNLRNKMQEIKLPKNPKFIFTSNDFASFELFKMFAAITSERGIQYVIGQHGNNYGTNRLISPTLEERTCTKFITWGWGKSDQKYIPGFILKVTGRKIKSDPNGNLLLVLHPLGIGKNSFASNYAPSLYLNNQKKFLDLLGDEKAHKTVLRFHGGTTNSIESDIEQFKEITSSVLIDKGGGKFKKLIASSRLCVYSYDSTGLLENLAMNIPTLAFWQFGLKHLNKEAEPYYQLLVDVGIVHLSPESAVEKVNHIWSDVDTWWQSSTIQTAREKFCYNYARTSEAPIRHLRRILKDI